MTIQLGRYWQTWRLAKKRSNPFTSFCCCGSIGLWPLSKRSSSHDQQRRRIWGPKQKTTPIFPDRDPSSWEVARLALSGLVRPLGSAKLGRYQITSRPRTSDRSEALCISRLEISLAALASYYNWPAALAWFAYCLLIRHFSG